MLTAIVLVGLIGAVWQRSLFRDADAYLAKRVEERLANLRLVPVEDQPMRPPKAKELSGDAVFAKHSWWLRNLPTKFESSEAQFELYETYQQCHLNLFYHREWQTEQTRIMQRHNLTEHKRHSLIFAQRRLGKSMATSKYIFACLMTMPFQHAIFAHRKRQAIQLLTGIKQEIYAIPEAERTFTIVRDNQEQLVIKDDVLGERGVSVMAATEVSDFFSFFSWGREGGRGTRLAAQGKKRCVCSGLCCGGCVVASGEKSARWQTRTMNRRRRIHKPWQMHWRGLSKSI